MKTLNILIILISLVGFNSCDKNNDEEINVISVESYIELLRSNNYDSQNLPAFTYNDIAALLEYRNETEIISDFPHNVISSLYTSECKLGMYVLWTIESIRAVAIDSKYLMMRFPSQNPILALQDSEELDLVYDNQSHDIIAKAYFDWWENNNHMNFEEFKNVDPLTETNYRWH